MEVISLVASATSPLDDGQVGFCCCMSPPEKTNDLDDITFNT